MVGDPSTRTTRRGTILNPLGIPEQPIAPQPEAQCPVAEEQMELAVALIESEPGRTDLALVPQNQVDTLVCQPSPSHLMSYDNPPISIHNNFPPMNPPSDPAYDVIYEMMKELKASLNTKDDELQKLKEEVRSAHDREKSHIQEVVLLKHQVETQNKEQQAHSQRMMEQERNREAQYQAMFSEAQDKYNQLQNNAHGTIEELTKQLQNLQLERNQLMEQKEKVITQANEFAEIKLKELQNKIEKEKEITQEKERALNALTEQEKATERLRKEMEQDKLEKENISRQLLVKNMEMDKYSTEAE
ncbi:MAG: hypothetical protein ACRC28_04080, partial [Clostridium sp.]